MPVDPKRILHVFDSLDYQLAIYDRAWRYTYVNEEAARMLGRSPAELVGRSIWDLFPDMVGKQYHRELHDVVRTGQAIHSEHLHEPSGRWFEHHIYPSMSSRHAPAVRALLRERWPERYQSLPLGKALLRLHRTPRVYKDHYTVVDPDTRRECRTLAPSIVDSGA